jgi:membrane protein DedA with SNARE-associated domain
MLNSILDWILEIIVKFGLWGVFFGSLLEELIAPIPSPMVMMASGAALLGRFEGISAEFLGNLLLISLIGAAGALIGSYLPYSIGYFGGKPLIEKTSKFTGVSWKMIEKMQARLDKSSSDELTIGTLRAIPVMPSVLIAASCGVMRINPLTYAVSFYVGGVVRNLIFLILGWQLGSAYMNSANTFEDISSIVQKVIIAIFILALGYLYWRRHKAEKEDLNN